MCNVLCVCVALSFGLSVSLSSLSVCTCMYYMYVYMYMSECVHVFVCLSVHPLECPCVYVLHVCLIDLALVEEAKCVRFPYLPLEPGWSAGCGKMLRMAAASRVSGSCSENILKGASVLRRL